ncbi:hypothetical protein HWC54_gp130 [Klebsiella phage Marfa]|uniref:Transmembrane protein n=1 Tax=Klebsiella phage Marfa TaxID=2587809 RepID=A0A4Y5TQW2_9CAUD|nr:hypothetical protein HWC54_gp130 [Klebsiella phage Marfa]QDB71785.1 hypothetical protein CPT_Marfa_130 [Klebsiella phage Marfa]
MARYYRNKPIDWGYTKVITDKFLFILIGITIGLCAMIFYPAFMINEMGAEMSVLSILIMIVTGFSFGFPIMAVPYIINGCAKLKHMYNYRKEVKEWEKENAEQRLLDSRDETLAFLKEIRK